MSVNSFRPTTSQLAAIEAPPGPALVLAGPGAGKTYCLIERIRYLIEREGLEPARINAFTFTNKAGEEIGSRLDDLGSRPLVNADDQAFWPSYQAHGNPKDRPRFGSPRG